MGLSRLVKKPPGGVNRARVLQGGKLFIFDNGRPIYASRTGHLVAHLITDNRQYCASTHPFSPNNVSL
jgi:hypothetical protein